MTNENIIEQNSVENDSVGTDKASLSGDKDTTGNRRDEAQILTDQDMTNEHDITDLDENMGAKSHSMGTMEDEPEDFVSGEIDVVTQMDRTTRHMEEVIQQSSGRKAHPKGNIYKR